jgi:hypothetical protein
MDQELVAYFDERFREMREDLRQEIHGVREELGQEIHGVREELKQEIQSFREETGQRFEKVEEEIRHTQILVEAGRGDIRMVAEGTCGLDERLGFFRKEVQQEFDDVRKLIRPVYSSLDQRLRTLEVRKDLQGRDPIEVIKERFGFGKKPE